MNLLQSIPSMPTLQAMHRALAKHPMLQVELFLLLDDLVHVELCCMHGFIGRKRYGAYFGPPPATTTSRRRARSAWRSWCARR